jgi:hypothetical protein
MSTTGTAKIWAHDTGHSRNSLEQMNGGTTKSASSVLTEGGTTGRTDSGLRDDLVPAGVLGHVEIGVRDPE